MTAMVCAQRVHGATIGATIMAGFGGAWLTLGMLSAGGRLAVALAAVLPVFVLAAAIGWAIRRRAPMTAVQESPADKQRGRAFAAVNVVQWLAIVGVLNLFRVLGWNAWTMSALVLIVGVHFLPLARLFGARQHWVTGVSLIVLALASVAIPAPLRDTIECLSCGVVLWLSAANALRCASRLLPAASPSEPVGLRA